MITPWEICLVLHFDALYSWWKTIRFELHLMFYCYYIRTFSQNCNITVHICIFERQLLLQTYLSGKIEINHKLTNKKKYTKMDIIYNTGKLILYLVIDLYQQQKQYSFRIFLSEVPAIPYEDHNTCGWEIGSTIPACRDVVSQSKFSYLQLTLFSGNTVCILIIYRRI